MVQSIGNTVQWPLPLYNTPDIGVDDARFQKIISRRTTGDIQIFPGFANNGDYFLVNTNYAATDNYIKYYNSAMSLQWTKNETDFQGPYSGMSAISGITLQGSELFVLVSNATNSSTGNQYNLAKVVAGGTVTSIGGATVTNLELGFMGQMGYLSKPLGKSNFYATGFMSAVEISASNGSAVESYANNLVSINVPATFITSDNRSFNLQTGTGAVAEPVLWHNNFNPTFGLDGTPVTGVTSNNPIIQRHNVLGSVPWQMTPFSRAREMNCSYQFIDWGDYYILSVKSTTGADANRFTTRGFWLKTRLDSWMKQFCDLHGVPVNNTFAS
tara:strand:+ start:184 stop:1167 length:984 start_codon:yes stop_codon:yes gene_type:complete